MNILIIGAGGFIGRYLTRAILQQTDFHVTGMDLNSTRLRDSLFDPFSSSSFKYFEQDFTKDMDFLEARVKAADVVIPLAAIANPMLYVQQPLRVFELDFEANLKLVRLVVKHKKRLIFPSTSEVYGMCQDEQFDPLTSPLILGPIHEQRWIYSCSKQMMDRVIYAYGMQEGLNYTLFRPFNWVGPHLDDIYANGKPNSRAFTQFISNALYGHPLKIVGDGHQKRSFIYIEDAIDALLRILKSDTADQQIFNIGNPENTHSVKELAHMVLEEAKNHPNTLRQELPKIEHVKPLDYFGKGYADTKHRVPSVLLAEQLLGWRPSTSLKEAIRKTFEYYCSEVPLFKRVA